MVSFENFVKSMPPSLLELKVTPSFCFSFKIPDDPTATTTYLVISTFFSEIHFSMVKTLTRLYLQILPYCKSSICFHFVVHFLNEPGCISFSSHEQTQSNDKMIAGKVSNLLFSFS